MVCTNRQNWSSCFYASANNTVTAILSFQIWETRWAAKRFQDSPFKHHKFREGKACPSYHIPAESATNIEQELVTTATSGSSHAGIYRLSRRKRKPCSYEVDTVKYAGLRTSIPLVFDRRGLCFWPISPLRTNPIVRNTQMRINTQGCTALHLHGTARVSKSVTSPSW